MTEIDPDTSRTYIQYTRTGVYLMRAAVRF